MNRDETKNILKTIFQIFPHRNWEQSDLSYTIDLWSALFVDEPHDLVAAALKAFIVSDTKGFAPSPGQIKEKIRLISQPEQMTEQEAWQIVYAAASKSSYAENAKAAHEKLPDQIKQLVRIEQLQEWAKMESSEVQTVVASNFMRSFRERRIQRERYEALPADVKAVIEGTERMGIEHGMY